MTLTANPTRQPGRVSPTHRPATFADAIRSEALKLRTVKSTFITLGVAILLGVGVGTLISYLAGSHHASGGFGGQTGFDPLSTSLAAIGIAQLAIAVLGVMVVTGEYSSGMIRTSLTAVPRRRRLLGAKLVVYTAVALVVGEVTAFGAFLIGQVVIGLNAPNTNLGAHDVLRSVIGAGLYLAAIGLLSCGVGALLRNTAAGIGAMVALLFVLPGVVQALPSSWRNPVTEFWPTQAGSQIFTVVRGANTLPAWAGFGVLMLFTVIVLGFAMFTLDRRDA